MTPVTNTRSAIKTLRRRPANTAACIAEKVEAYATDPALLANIVAELKGRKGIRLTESGALQHRDAFCRPLPFAPSRVILRGHMRDRQIEKSLK